MVSKTYAKLREVVITYSLPAKMFAENIYHQSRYFAGWQKPVVFFPKAFHDIDVDQFPGRDQFNDNQQGKQSANTNYKELWI